MAFVKDDPAKAASLAASIQKLVEAQKSKDLRGFVVVVSGPEQGPAIAKAAKDQKVTISVAHLAMGPKQDDFAAYKVNPEAKNTVLVYQRHKVFANFVNVDEKSFPKVAKAAEEMLAK